MRIIGERIIMSVNVEVPAVSEISQPLSLLKETTLVMHKIYFEVDNVAVWYAIVNEARQLFGSNWRGQSRVKRRLEKRDWYPQRNRPKPEIVWFEVPDPGFATWITVKYSVLVKINGTK